jgi:hypothetical protein
MLANLGGELGVPRVFRPNPCDSLRGTHEVRGKNAPLHPSLPS